MHLLIWVSNRHFAAGLFIPTMLVLLVIHIFCLRAPIILSYRFIPSTFCWAHEPARDLRPVVFWFLSPREVWRKMSPSRWGDFVVEPTCYEPTQRNLDPEATLIIYIPQHSRGPSQILVSPHVLLKKILMIIEWFDVSLVINHIHIPHPTSHVSGSTHYGNN